MVMAARCSCKSFRYLRKHTQQILRILGWMPVTQQARDAGTLFFNAILCTQDLVERRFQVCFGVTHSKVLANHQSEILRQNGHMCDGSRSSCIK